MDDEIQLFSEFFHSILPSVVKDSNIVNNRAPNFVRLYFALLTDAIDSVKILIEFYSGRYRDAAVRAAVCAESAINDCKSMTDAECVHYSQLLGEEERLRQEMEKYEDKLNKLVEFCRQERIKITQVYPTVRTWGMFNKYF